MALEVGSRLGPYHVTAKIGEGGMGEVYRARDTTLDLNVRVSDDACEIGPPDSGLTPAHPGVGPGLTCTYLPSIQTLPDRSNCDRRWYVICALLNLSRLARAANWRSTT